MFVCAQSPQSTRGKNENGGRRRETLLQFVHSLWHITIITISHIKLPLSFRILSGLLFLSGYPTFVWLTWLRFCSVCNVASVCGFLHFWVIYKFNLIDSLAFSIMAVIGTYCLRILGYKFSSQNFQTTDGTHSPHSRNFARISLESELKGRRLVTQRIDTLT